MLEFRKLIASPSALFTFEAAARFCSFTRAAKELGVTQAAVSFAIKSLEQNLGVMLFQREHKHLELTEAGERFYQDVAMGLGHIGRSAEALHRNVTSNHVTLSCSTAFASHWIIPRLQAFRANHPDIDFRIQTSDRDINIITEKIHLGIRRGHGEWAEYESYELAREILFPVCNPSYLETQGPVRDLNDLAERKLIHLEEPHRPRPTWDDWFKHHKIKYRDDQDGLRLNDYALVVQAAIGSQGIAMGWSHIVDHPMRQGLLVKAIDLTWQTDQRFYVVASKDIALSDDGETIRRWILEEAKLASPWEPNAPTGVDLRTD